MNTDRKEYWLLRYVNGDAFALAWLPYRLAEVRYTRTTGAPPTLVYDEVPPLEFGMMIEDTINKVLIMNYNYEVVPQAVWETQQAFGLPLLCVIDDDMSHPIRIRI